MHIHSLYIYIYIVKNIKKELNRPSTFVWISNWSECSSRKDEEEALFVLHKYGRQLRSNSLQEGLFLCDGVTADAERRQSGPDCPSSLPNPASSTCAQL